MSKSRAERELLIKELIRDIALQGDSFSVTKFAEGHSINKVSVYRYIKVLDQKKTIESAFSGRRKIYRLVDQELTLSFPLKGLAEDIVWSKQIHPFLAELPVTAYRNLRYAFTEMLNNAIDHSEGTTVHLFVMKNAFRTSIVISDNGIGIFTKIANAMQLEEKSFAILELAKGKFTTDPKSHTGEGVFFSSKVVDSFAIFSDDLVFLGPTSSEAPFLDQYRINHAGTTVGLEIENDHAETVKEVFDRFVEAPESYGFTKTIVPVRLLEYGDETPQVISRSQAKRLMVRFERFENILLDFSGIDEIGQGFADELFRVFSAQHPGTSLTPINCNPNVMGMIQRAMQNQKLEN